MWYATGWYHEVSFYKNVVTDVSDDASEQCYRNLIQCSEIATRTNLCTTLKFYYGLIFAIFMHNIDGIHS